MGMKPMITSRQNRSFVSISKLWETDDALDAVFEALSVEVYDGNWSKNGWIDTGQLFDGYSYMLIIAAFIVMIIVTNIVTFNNTTHHQTKNPNRNYGKSKNNSTID